MWGHMREVNATGRDRGNTAVVILAACAVGYLIIKYAIGYVLPFVIGYAAALGCVPIANKLEAHTRLPRKLCRVLVMSVLLASLGALIYLAARRGAYELSKLVERVENDGGVPRLFERLKRIGAELPIVGGLFRRDGSDGYLEGVISSAAESAVSSLAAELAGTVGGMLSKMPSILLFLAVAVISGFYFCAELEDINAFLAGIFPKKVQIGLPRLKRQAAGTAMRYLRASLTLLLLTAAELYFGFLILGVDYSLLLALTVAVVDILPVLGVWTVLVPWALVELLMRHYFVGVGLLILYAVVSLLRQIAEPRIVGKSLGVHPLVTLISTYVGYKLLGFLGMLLSPFVALALSCVIRAHRRTEPTE